MDVAGVVPAAGIRLASAPPCGDAQCAATGAMMTEAANNKILQFRVCIMQFLYFLTEEYNPNRHEEFPSELGAFYLIFSMFRRHNEMGPA
jgi:hypothetical protein